MIDSQEARNERLRAEIKVLDKQIEEINDLEIAEAALHRAHAGHREAAALALRDRARVRRGRQDHARRHLPDRVQADRPAAQVRGRGAVIDARVDVHAQHRRLAVAEGSGTRGGREQAGQHRRQQLRARTPSQIATAGDEDEAPGRADKPKRAASPEVRNEPAAGTARARSARPGPLAVARCAPARSASASWCWRILAALLLRLDQTSSRSSQQLRTRSSSCATSSTTKHAKATNLDVYKQQLADIEKSFGAMLRQLPSKTEVDNLLVDISQTGLAAGAGREAVPAAGRGEARISTPSGRSRSASRAAITSSARSSAASRRCRASSRCTTSQITPADEDAAVFDQLQMDLTAKTYRYLDDEEVAAAEADRRKAKQAAGGRGLMTQTRMGKRMKQPYNRLSALAAGGAVLRGARRLLGTRRRPGALHRGDQEGAGRPRRAAARSQALRQLSPTRAPACVRRSCRAVRAARASRACARSAAQPRVPRAVLARHAEDGRHAQARAARLTAWCRWPTAACSACCSATTSARTTAASPRSRPSRSVVTELVPDGLGGYIERPAAAGTERVTGMGE